MRNFEDILRDKLYEATNDYSDSVWKNIKGQIPIEKKRNTHLLWMASFLLVFAMMITMVQQYPNWKIDESAKKAVEVENDGIRYSSIEFSPQYNSQTIGDVENVVKDNLDQLNTNTQTIKEQSADASLTTLSDASRSNIIQTRIDNIEKDKTGIAIENAIPFSFIEGPSIPTDQKEIFTQARNTQNNLTSISRFNSGLKLPVTLPENILKKSKGNDVHCEVLRGKQSKYYISARHINSYAFNELSAKSSASDEYIDSRHATESKRYSFTDEVTFGVEHRNGFFAELGIRYDQINEKFNYLDPNAFQSATIVTVDTVFNDNIEEVLIDTITTVLAGEREILSNNHFKKLSIPFSVGYEYPLNKKVSLAAKAGLVVNVLSHYEGKIFDEELNVVSIEERQSSNNPLFNKLVHSVSGSAFLQYKMNKNMEFLVGVNAYKNLNATSFETNPIDQKYTSLGIFIGGKYNL